MDQSSRVIFLGLHRSALVQLKRRSWALVLILASAMSWVSPQSRADDVLIPLGSTWRYLDNGTDQGTTWRNGGFNDSTWSSGPAELGYGDGDEATTVGFGPLPNNKYITTYFRYSFNVANPSLYTVLNLRLIRDDGVAVYLNGTEVMRNNLPGGTIGFQTLAVGAIGGTDELTFVSTTANPNVLVAGNNVVAVEMHQNGATSSDLSFNLELIGSTSPVVNNPPTVSIVSPVNNASFSAPATIGINAAAADSDGSVSKVEFFQGTTKLGEDVGDPYTFNWTGVPVGTYQLRAVVTDNLGLMVTSSVVNVSVSLPNPPTIQSKVPVPGTVNSLSQITVTFSEAVQGVEAQDLVINGLPATLVTGAGAVYSFTVPKVREGTVFVAWQGSPGIFDFENPPQALDPYGTGASWQYTLVDNVAPTILALDPPASASVNELDQIGVTFSEPVVGVNAADLVINGTPATEVNGHGDGPYEFKFPTPLNGTVNVNWAGAHGIRDQATAANAFAGGSWSYTLNTNAVFQGQIVINEVMFHASSESTAEEYVELFNRGPAAVNLLGWQLNGGINFTFPNVTVAANSYLVAAANTDIFTAKYPGVGNVVGNWTGQLSNTEEEIELEDASGNQVDVVRYADEGDFATRTNVGGGSLDWVSQADGLGRSLELRNAALSNEEGQNWMSSTIPNGTPGAANTVASANIPPMVLKVGHFPVVPRSTDPVTITAQVLDELVTGLTVRLFYRDATSTSPPGFTSVAMTDNGNSNDGASGDGVYGVVLPAMGNGIIIEFYVEAQDSTAQLRTWPAPAESGGPQQTANALFQVDNEVYAGNQPIYRLVMRAADRNGLVNQQDRVERNATFITIDGDDVELRYLCGVRRRGASSFSATPPTMKLNIPADRKWKGKSSMNLNSINTHSQVLCAALAAKAGMPAAAARAVQLRFNGVNLSVSGSQMFGSYAHVEVLDNEWAEDHLPDDPNGNLYSKRRPECGLLYQGANPSGYINCAYDKESNVSENDWTDLMSLTFALDPSRTPDSDYVRAVLANVNVELWQRYFAVSFLMNYNETALSTGADDDYNMYRGAVDKRFMVLAHDLDACFGTAGNSANDLFVGALMPTMNRFLRHPQFQPLFYEEYRRQLAGAFETNALFHLMDQVLGDWAPGSLQSLKINARDRINFVTGALPAAPTVVRATVSGEPDSPTYLNTATLTVGGSDITHYRYRLNNGALSAQQTVATPLNLSGLADGTYTVFVIGRNSAGVWQEESVATVSKTWAVLSNLRGVVFNEILARNDSAVNHSGTFPDIIELYHAGTGTLNLGGMRLTDDLDDPNKFVFSAGTSLVSGNYLTLYANNPDGTSGIHLGFSLDQTGETLYLLESDSSGGKIRDQVKFGLQLPNLSVGRLSNGQWGLTTPTIGAANTAAALGNPAGVKINEWLAAAALPFSDDFIELYNPGSLPVALGGLYLTDNPFGQPFLHQITPLSFLGGLAYQAFAADGNKSAGADHLDFSLSEEYGEIALIKPDGQVIDRVVYGLQQPGISMGRTPNGGDTIVFINQPTPGAGNPVVTPPPAPITISLIPIDDVWAYDQSGADLGTSWKETTFNDASWLTGPALLGEENSPLPEPLRTPVLSSLSGGPVTIYFRTHFDFDASQEVSTIELTHIIDDGAIFYINGTELGRYNMPGGPVNFQTLAPTSVGNAVYQGPMSIPLGALVDGDNVMAVEIHQQSTTSSDVVFGLALNAVILTNNPVAAGVVINEVLANNATLLEPDGSNPDWVEFYNPSDQALDMADMSLTDNPANPRRWVFPTGSVAPATGYLRIRFDGGSLASNTNTGFGLDATGDEVYLFNRLSDGGALRDSIAFGLQAPDWPIGRVPDGGTTITLVQPSPGALNLAAALGDIRQLKVNEWMADPGSGGGDDWFEIYNPNPQPVALGGLHLTDDLNDRLKSPIQARSYIGTGLRGFQEFQADEGSGANHADFKLAAGGESLGISDSNGTLIDGITFGAQTTGVSQGRLPDGTANVVGFPGTASPGNSNFLPINNVAINEILTHTDPPFEDAIELRNLTGSPVDVSGWYLSDANTVLKKFRIPNGTTIAGNGFVVFYEYQFNPNPGDPVSFSLSSAKGDEVFLSQATLAGVLTGYKTSAEFGPSANGVSFGRYVTSQGVDFTAMSLRTFGQDNAETLAQFRTGTGLANSLPLVGPVVINEIMYRPPDMGILDNTRDEFIELHNVSAFAVPLYDPAFPANTWRLRKAVSFDFPPGTSIPVGGHLVVVSFNPTAEPATAAAFRTAYGIGMSVNLVGPYLGKLDNSSDRIDLFKPDPPQTAPSPDEGLVPYVLADRVLYGDLPPWPTSPDGLGHTLQRVNSALYGNDPVNWAAAAPTPGSNNFGSSVNSPPTLSPIGNKTVIESNLLSFTAVASDTDTPTQTLTFSLDVGAPAGASITPAGAFTWRPTEAQGPGGYSVTVRVTDNGSPNLSDTETISITVNEANLPPALGVIGNQTVNEGVLVSFTASGTDPDLPVQALTYSLAAGAPTGASIDPATGAFTWTPDETQGPAATPITVVVTDNGSPPLNAQRNFTVTVNEVNVAPVLAPIGNKSVVEGSLLTFTATTTDADRPNQTLTYSLDSGAPSGATINANSGVFTWTPNPSQGPASHPITVRVTDNGTPPMNDSETITVNVTETSTSVEMINITGNWRFNDSGADLGTAWRATGFNDSAWTAGPALFFNEVDPLPAAKNTPIPLTTSGGARIITFYFRTHFFLAADTAGVTLSSQAVIDDGLVIYLNGVEAARFNMPAGPVTAGTFASASHEGSVFETIPINAASLVSGDNVLAVEVHQVTLSSTDVDFGLSVTAQVPPQTPIAISTQPANRTVNTGQSATFSVTATGSFPVYQWFKNSAAIPGANASSFTILNAQESDEGTFYVVVSNLVNSVQSANATLTVNPPPNAAPVLGSIGNKSVNEGALLSFTATATDADVPGQTLTFTLDATPPANASITTGGAFTWTPSETQGPGVYPVTIRVTDNGTPPMNDFETISITVSEVNVAPVLDPIGDRAVTVSSNLTINATATDADRPVQALTYSLGAGAPASASINPSTGVFTWTPPLGHTPMTNRVTIIVTDAGTPPRNDSEAFDIVVAGEPNILSITRTGGTITIVWKSLIGKRYQPQHRAAADTGAWINLGSALTSTGSTTQASDTIGTNTKRYYRIVLLD